MNLMMTSLTPYPYDVPPLKAEAAEKQAAADDAENAAIEAWKEESGWNAGEAMEEEGRRMMEEGRLARSEAEARPDSPFGARRMEVDEDEREEDEEEGEEEVAAAGGHEEGGHEEL
jgi:hypothetical protein